MWYLSLVLTFNWWLPCVIVDRLLIIFLRIFSPPCPTCNRTIMPTDVVRLVGSVAFHPECFCCSLCSRYLSTGDEYRPLGNGQRVICLEHEASIRKRAGGEDLGSTRSPQRTDMSLTEEDGEVGMENGGEWKSSSVENGSNRQLSSTFKWNSQLFSRFNGNR